MIFHIFQKTFFQTEVIFPDSLEEIGQEAFINCVNLKSAVYKKGVKVDPTSFKGCIQLER